jgi:hypothetical protein
MSYNFQDTIIDIAALVAILDYFGLRPKSVSSWNIMPLSRRWKLILMLSLVAAALGMSGFNFYRSLHPKIIEKVVTKTIEKPVPIPCPEPAKVQQSEKKKNTPDDASGKQQPGKENVQSGSITQGCGSIQQGGKGNQASVNCGPPPLPRISNTQANEISLALGAYAGRKANIYVVEPTDDANKLATDLDLALKNAGIKSEYAGSAVTGFPVEQV